MSPKGPQAAMLQQGFKELLGDILWRFRKGPIGNVEANLQWSFMECFSEVPEISHFGFCTVKVEGIREPLGSVILSMLQLPSGNL